MAGIYIHIPFCKKACHYCNFHFSTSLKLKRELIEQITKEIRLRKNYLSSEILDSVYFGGGTPSLLSPEELSQIFTTLQDLFQIKSGAEITLEANPDDINNEQLEIFEQFGINRLSLGVQSFNDVDLVYMNRSHNAEDAIKSLDLIRQFEFILSADLIFGIPDQHLSNIDENISILLDYEVEHISAYALTVEPKTALHHFINKGKRKNIDQEIQSHQFNHLHLLLQNLGYDHYEISNYARNQHYALHNSNYWRNEPYLGIGPGAHSFDGKTRSWNIANNPKYIKSLQLGHLPLETEELSESDQFNEKLITSLRTKWGINTSEIRNFTSEIQKHFNDISKELLVKGLLVYDSTKDNYCIPTEKWVISDQVCRALLYVPD